MTDNRPVLIGIDWGTTSFRAYRIGADGAVIEVVASAEGITNVPAGGFEETFEAHVGPWLAENSALPVLASGMITSRNGWFETGYVEAPAGAAELAAGLVDHETQAGRILHFAPGLICHDPTGNPDVMRGEETQMVGCLALGVPDGTFVMPGTHSKWATTVGGRLTGFQTFMTGEVYAVMVNHSLLGKLIPGDGWSETAFANGVDASLAGRDSILHLLFMARSRVLIDVMKATDITAYLSGLLIGEELRSGIGGLTDGAQISVVGGGALVDRYLAAMSTTSIVAKPAPSDAVARGHFEIAKHAGLIQ